MKWTCIPKACILLLLIPCFSGFGASSLAEGEKLFLENKPQEAGALLEQALNEEPANEKIYLYLGIIYEQLDHPDKSIQIMKRGLNVATELKDILYFNIGNNFFRQGDYNIAEEMYTNAISIDGKFHAAYLNRANTRLQNEEFNDALADYVLYLQLNPASPQAAQIRQVINILKASIEEEERKKQEALDKQRALLNNVLNSLKNASEDARNVSAGSEKVHVDFEDSDIED